MPRTIKPFVPCTRWRTAMMEMKTMRKAVRLARKRNDPNLNLKNDQIRHIVIFAYQAKTKPSVATLQQRLSQLNKL